MRVKIMKTKNPGKQRKAFYNAPLHKKRKMLSSHLEESLLLKYDQRSIPVVKGDTVMVMRGNFKGHEDKVVGVNTKKNTIHIEGITMAKADGNKIPKPIHPSNVVITKLNLTDKWRRNRLERDLSEEAKKEIEKEAAEQIKEAEAEQKRIEEELARQEAEKEQEETAEEEKEEKPKTTTDEKKTSEKKVEEKTKKQTTAEKKDTAKKPAQKKTASKKTTPNKKPTAKKETKPKTAAKKTPKKKASAKKEDK